MRYARRMGGVVSQIRTHISELVGGQQQYSRQYPSGSIGDLMNLKGYCGSSGDVRDSLIARTVPLSTVCKPPSSQQRTQRLSRLISQQKNSQKRNRKIAVSAYFIFFYYHY